MAARVLVRSDDQVFTGFANPSASYKKVQDPVEEMHQPKYTDNNQLFVFNHNLLVHISVSRKIIIPRLTKNDPKVYLDRSQKQYFRLSFSQD